MGAATVEIEGAADPLPNPRHEAFARLVASGMATAAAYREAGYVSKSPDSHGARLADSGSIAARIAYLRMDRTTAIRAASLVDAHRIQQELEAVALSDIGDAFEEHIDQDSGVVIPRAKPITRWPEAFRRAVSSVKVKRFLEGPPDNQREFELLEFKLWPKVPAIHELRDHMGLLKPIELNVTHRGVILLPVLQAPMPGPNDRVLSGEIQSHTPAEVVSTATTGLTAARDALLSRLLPRP